ncbi:hypothetical protein HMI55_005585 [Coelomomyces lativittatus]|nr:hypothetical protein HMI55_005585 [Coelomomyces lativittatus]
MLAGLGIWNNKWPPFASHLVFELFEKNTPLQSSSSTSSISQPSADSYYVRVRYNDSSFELPGCAEPYEHYPGDPTLCTYSAFKKIMKEISISRKEYAHVCRAPDVQH